MRRLERNSDSGNRPELSIVAWYFENDDDSADLGIVMPRVSNCVHFDADPTLKSFEPDYPLSTMQEYLDQICNYIEQECGHRPVNEDELRREYAEAQRF